MIAPDLSILRPVDTYAGCRDTYVRDIYLGMQLQHRRDLDDDIADALEIGAGLLARHLGGNEKFSLTARAVLATLADGGATRLTGLAASGGITQPAMTQLVGRLERDDLVVRLIDPDDGRVTLVDITDSGRALLAQLKQSRRAELAELLETLSPSDEFTLSLAMRVALPLLQELTNAAANRPHANAFGRDRTPVDA
jgi:DNA-binding MarR family transcriptional regulator